MQAILVPVVAGFAIFVAGILLSQKVKDWFAGVPAHVRADLSAVEVSLLGRVKAAQSAVLADLKAKVTPATPVLQTTVTAAVAAPVPANDNVKPAA